MSDDLAKARADVIYRGGGEASVARNVHLIALMLGVLVLVMGAFLGGLGGAMSWLGGVMMLVGVLGWLAYPRFPGPTSLVALVFVVLFGAVIVILGLIASAIVRLLAVGALTGLAMVFRGTLAGIRVGRRVARLRLRGQAAGAG